MSDARENARKTAEALRDVIAAAVRRLGGDPETARAIVCGRTTPPFCTGCGAADPAYQCDRRRKDGRPCNRHLCEHCADHPAPGVDECPNHKPQPQAQPGLFQGDP